MRSNTVLKNVLKRHFGIDANDEILQRILDEILESGVIRFDSAGLANAVALTRERREAVITQESLANEIGVSVGTIMNYEASSYTSAPIKNYIKILRTIEKYEKNQSEPRSKSRGNSKSPKRMRV